MICLISLSLLFSLSFSFSSSINSAGVAATRKKIAIVTGGTRGIGSGIAEALAEAGYDLLLTYNTDKDSAEKFRKHILDNFGTTCNRVECVGGDISLSTTRDGIFSCLDIMTTSESELSVMVHNAGQYVGITSENSEGLTGRPLMFGDGSLLDDKDGSTSTNLDTLNYYHRMYGEAFVDLCERSLTRMNNGGSLIGMSSPGPTAHYYGPDPSYSMPGSGKCLMEYAMRIYALKAAEKKY